MLLWHKEEDGTLKCGPFKIETDANGASTLITDLSMGTVNKKNISQLKEQAEKLVEYILRAIIVRSTVVQVGHGTDICMLRVSMPDSLPKVSNEGLYLEFKAEKGTGSEYIRKNFGIEPIVINE